MSYKLIAYKNPQEFWSQLSPVLRQEEAKNSLMLGLSYFALTNPNGIAYQSALFNEGQFVGAIICSQYLDQCNLISTEINDEMTVKAMLDQCLNANISVTAVIGELKTATLYDKLLLKSGKSKLHQVKQGLYKCSKVKVPKNNDLIFRIASLKDISVLGKWMNDFCQEALPHESSVDGYKLIENKINAHQAYVLEKSGELVSIACWTRDIVTSCSVNFVYTPKTFRQKGYASFVTAKITEKLLGQGKKETNLYTDMANPTSNKIYQEIGYELVCHSSHTMYQ